MDPLSLGYDEFATRHTKNAIGAFTAVCVFVVIFKTWGFGFGWPVVWLIGIFVVSIVNAPFVIAEWFLLKFQKDIFAIGVNILHTFGALPFSYYSLKLIHDRIF